MYCTWLAGNAGCKKSPSGHHHTTLLGYIFPTMAHNDNQKKLIKHPYLLHMSPQYGELRLTSGWDRFVWDTAANFSGSRLGFVTAATSLNGSHPNFAGCLAISWAGTLRIHFGASCQVQNSLCILQVLRSHILVALLHSTWAVGASQTLRRWAQGVTYIWQGDHHVGHWPTF